MPRYVPFHDRSPHYANLPSPPRRPNQPRSPRYASPDLGPEEAYSRTREGMMAAEKQQPVFNLDLDDEDEEYDQHEDEGDYEQTNGVDGNGTYDDPQHEPSSENAPGYGDDYDPASSPDYEGQDDPGPSRKRPRPAETNGHDTDAQQPSASSSFVPRARPAQPAQPVMPIQQPTFDPSIPIMPSIFGISPRNEFTKTIGEFIMANSRGRENVEIEIKLGKLHAPLNQAEGVDRRVRLPSLTELILPPDYPIGNFASNMTKAQNQSLNRLLNQATEYSQQSPAPIRFFRARQIDSFYGQGQRGSKIRVSRDQEGNVIPGGSIRKKRVADVNIYSPNGEFDWRVSVSTEEPMNVPDGPSSGEREKDRACYEHQFCRVDLTVVTARSDHAPPVVTFELEIEVLDVPALLLEGEKEERGEESRFDEILQSILDSVRMVIRNVGGA